MENRAKALRNVAIFAMAVLLCLLLPSAARHFAADLFAEFRAPIDSLPSRLSDLEKFWLLHSNSKRALIEAGRDLARLNSAYELKLRENLYLKNRLQRYEEILKIPAPDKFKAEVARVIRRDISAWWQYIVIRKGSADGIRPGQAVVYSGGVVGRVAKTTRHTATVELVSSGKFRMAAQFEGEDRPVIYQGGGASSFRSARGVVSDVPEDVRVSPSEPLRLVTSPLAGSFPEGIFIGNVVELRLDHDALFKSGVVRLSNGLDNLREVSVLVPIDEAAN